MHVTGEVAKALIQEATEKAELFRSSNTVTKDEDLCFEGDEVYFIFLIRLFNFSFSFFSSFQY
jgi:hypothetical protein